MAKTSFASVSDYIAAQPVPVQRALTKVRAAIRKALPKSEEGISYQIPVYKIDGRRVVYFAGFKEHYSVYPTSKRMETELKDEFAPYELSGRGTIRFPLSAPVPVRLIAAIAKYRAREVADGAKAKKQR